MLTTVHAARTAEEKKKDLPCSTTAVKVHVCNPKTNGIDYNTTIPIVRYEPENQRQTGKRRRRRYSKIGITHGRFARHRSDSSVRKTPIDDDSEGCYRSHGTQGICDATHVCIVRTTQVTPNPHRHGSGMFCCASSFFRMCESCAACAHHRVQATFLFPRR